MDQDLPLHAVSLLTAAQIPGPIGLVLGELYRLDYVKNEIDDVIIQYGREFLYLDKTPIYIKNHSHIQKFHTI